MDDINKNWYSEYVTYLKTHYHDRQKVHGNINPLTITRYSENNNCDQPLVHDATNDVPFRHPEILKTGIAIEPKHDFYALFTTAVYLLVSCKIFNSPECPIDNQQSLFFKIDLFMQQGELKLLPEENKSILIYLWMLTNGTILL